MKDKKIIKNYRSSIFIMLVIVFNVIESFYFGAGTPMGFNLEPSSQGELICDSLCSIGFIFGILMMGYDWIDYLKCSLISIINET